MWWESVSNFITKANIFNDIFETILRKKVVSDLTSSYKTNSWIKSFQVTENDIIQIAKPLDPNKMHDWDSISIIIIQIWGKAITLLFH